jgi:hypothetical protein
MDYFNEPYRVFVAINEDGLVTAVNSSAFLTDPTGWTELDSGHGDKYHHAQGNYFEKPILTAGGAFQYKMVDGDLAECTAEEIRAQENANRKPAAPTQMDRIEAQVTYTAMMTDTLLEV